MSTLTIRHITTYRYLRPVAFGEHRMMLRPRDSHDQRVIEASLKIHPRPTGLLFVVDDFGNQIGIAQFSDCAQEFCVESVVCLKLSPSRVSVHDLEEHADRFPFDYSADEIADLSLCLERVPADPSPIPATKLPAGRANSCHRTGRLAPSSFSPNSRTPSIAPSAIGAAMRRVSSNRWRH
jgi:Bacterial transglutaminase-like N-terminal region